MSVVKKTISLLEGQLRYIPQFLSANYSRVLYNRLYREIAWQQEELKIFGKVHKVPRWVAWHGDTGIRYKYSGADHLAQPWIPALVELKEKIEVFSSASFNSVLLNLYRDGNDCMGWHSDNEKSLGPKPIIASISLGATRRFDVRKKSQKHVKHHLHLENGSLLIMQGNIQDTHHHQIPRQRKITDARINLTFRKIVQ